MNILTEEELKEYEKRRFDFGNWPIVNDLEAVIKSHRSLLSANAELSFKNKKFKKAMKEIIAVDMPDYEEDFTKMKSIATKALEELNHE